MYRDLSVAKLIKTQRLKWLNQQVTKGRQNKFWLKERQEKRPKMK